MRVVHLNVRLDEGGAARIALDLHRRLLERAVGSRFFYGYGSGAKRNPRDKAVPYAYQIGLRAQVVSNYFVHKLVGIDPFNAVGRRINSLKAAIREADIVHLHVIHSHFVSHAWLFSQLIRMNKKTVWTLHDSWAFTGRCAITGDCEEWMSGCGNCPYLNNYPSAKFDLSGFESRRKYKEVTSLRNNLIFVGCSPWITQRAMQRFPNHEIRFIPNGLDREMEACLAGSLPAREGRKRKLDLLIVGMDLSDSHKQDLDLIWTLIKSCECTIHTVGKYSPFIGHNVVNHGLITDRSRLAELYRSVDATIFTSKIDSFGLVILESLAAGTPVLALDSPGSNEVLSLIGAKPVRDENEVLSRVRQGSFLDLYQQDSRQHLQRRALEIFSGQKMMEQYLGVYESVLSRAAA